MGDKTNKLWIMIVDNWNRNGRRILSATGVFLIAVLLASIIPVSTLFINGGVWGTFGAKVYEYFIVLIIFIIGVVFGKPNGSNQTAQENTEETLIED